MTDHLAREIAAAKEEEVKNLRFENKALWMLISKIEGLCEGQTEALFAGPAAVGRIKRSIADTKELLNMPRKWMTGMRGTPHSQEDEEVT